MMSGISSDLSTLSFEWEAPEEGTPIGYDIYVDGELIKERHNALSYSTNDFNEDILDGKTHIAEVVAVYENEMTSVGALNIIISNWVNVNENKVKESYISVYPNPAKDFVKLSAVSGQLSAVSGQLSAVSGQLSVVKVYNCLGMLVEEIEVNADEVEIDVSEYNTGIYFFNIQTESENIVKKVIIND
jgi:hypothetical protein